MNYKEKYEMALEGIQEILSSGEDSIKMSRLQLRLQGIFPELKESEDEKIRKAIIEFFELQDDNTTYSFIPKKDILAWLEKQGEHANFRNKIQIGDKVTRNEDGMLVNLSQLNRVAKKDEQKTTDKVEPKFHEGDIIIHKELGGDYIHNSHKIIQVDILDKKYRLEGGLVAHFSEQDDYELVEQKPAWSEEEERMLDEMYEFFDKRKFPSLKHGMDDYAKLIKFLKDKYTWNPSDEQMNALDSTLQYNQVSQNSFGHLNSLFNDLKKLKKII